MASTELSLPIDIPWKRMGVSPDMIASGDGTKLPDNWRSSIAVFYYEPSDVQPDYCDRRITYLKVVCTITNYQLGMDPRLPDLDPAVTSDVSVLDKLNELYGDFYGWGAFHGTVNNSFPCYGALLQVIVLPEPNKKEVELQNYPYITAFQPRKREMYELLTLSGEDTSQSSNKVNVGKQGTATDTTEKYDLYTGYSDAGPSFLGIGGGSFSETGQFGNINRNQQVTQNVSSADTSREKRESYSHSTNINQLYTLLEGYHLGTNRALLFMQPRPHIQDAKFTFIRGLRRLDGIQEFFFIVDRPATVPGICVEAILETAHYWTYSAYQPRLIPFQRLFDPGNLDKTAAALGLDDPALQALHLGEYEATLAQAWNSVDARVRWLAENYQNPAIGLDQVQTLVDNGVINWRIWSQVTRVPALVPDIDLQDAALIFEEYETDDVYYPGLFFVTGRRLHCCVTPSHKDGEPDCEQSSKTNLSQYKEPASIMFEARQSGVNTSVGKTASDATALYLNSLVKGLNRAHQTSAGASNRFGFGELSFLATDVALEYLAQLIRLLGRAKIKNPDLRDLEEMALWIERGLGNISKVKTLVELGGLTTDQFMRDLKLTRLKAKKARRDVLVLALRLLDPKSLPAEYERTNPVAELRAFLYPDERLATLIGSGRRTGDEERK